MTMQNIKDSFYIALRDRLAQRNPARVVAVLGTVRPAILVVENEAPDSLDQPADTFLLSWGRAEVVRDVADDPRPLLRLEGAVRYWVQGSDTLSYQDRGRSLAASDADLLAITRPAWAPLTDFREDPPLDLGGNIFWTAPVLEAAEVDGRRLRRTARLSVFGCAAEVPA
jgi:hypothetical protein